MEDAREVVNGLGADFKDLDVDEDKRIMILKNWKDARSAHGDKNGQLSQVGNQGVEIHGRPRPGRWETCRLFSEYWMDADSAIETKNQHS